MMTNSCLTLCACALMLQAVSGQLAHQRPSDQIDLTGHWRLNASMSDALPLLPGESMTMARAAGVVPAAGRRSRAAGGPDPALVVTVRNALRTALQATAQLRIVQKGRTLTLVDAEDRELSVVADGKQQRLEHGGLRMLLAARWEAPLFTVTREYEDGTVIIDSYSTFSDPRQLVTISTISNRHMTEKPVIINRVYDPLER